MASELKNSIALCENILQKIQKSDDEREQLEMQLQSKTKKVTDLNEQLELFKQAGVWRNYHRGKGGNCLLAFVSVHVTVVP